jgi:hypothetical protein
MPSYRKDASCKCSNNTSFCQKRFPQAACNVPSYKNQKITKDGIFTSFIPVLQRSQTTYKENRVRTVNDERQTSQIMYRSIRKIDENRLEVVVREANDSMISLATAEEPHPMTCKQKMSAVNIEIEVSPKIFF